MHRLLLTLDTPAANIALDEALLDLAEATGPDTEFLRVWESPQPIVVVGRSSRVHVEVDEAACRERGIPILRRSSGGAAIVAGSGCLMYAVVLSYGKRPQLRDLTQAHAHVLDRHVEGLRSRLPSVVRQGTSDLAIGDHKFSGNSLRAKRTHFLYHGTLLYNLDLSLITTCLRVAPRQPAYRRSRDHGEFVANLPLSRQDIEDAALAAWPTVGELTEWPIGLVDRLVQQRYSQDEWNLVYGRASAARR